MSMQSSITTSIRLPIVLRQELEAASRYLKRGKNWIIIHALQAYLKQTAYGSLEKEAKIQSLRASSSEDAKAWEDNLDMKDWE